MHAKICNDQNNIITAILYSTVVLTRGPHLLHATLDARRVGCLCVAIIFASDRTKTQIVIYPNNRIIVNIQISRYNGINKNKKHWKNIRKTLKKHWKNMVLIFFVKNIKKTLFLHWKNIGENIEKTLDLHMHFTSVMTSG